MITKILHPTDFSDASLPALQAAHELAGRLGTPLIVCFVAHPPLIQQGDKLTDPKTHESRDITAELQTLCPSTASIKRELHIVIAEHSTKVKTMLGILDELGCDLIVLGMHKRAGIAGWLGHSITEEVVKLANCAVMVVKEDAESEDAETTEDSTAAE